MGVTSDAGGYFLPPPSFHMARARWMLPRPKPTAASAYCVSLTRFSSVCSGASNMSPERSMVSLSVPAGRKLIVAACVSTTSASPFMVGAGAS